MTMNSKQKSFIECIHPKNWLIVLGLVCTRIIVLLPFRIIVTIGQAMGLLLYRISSSRLQVARKNIELCFPALSATEQSNLVKQHFISLGIGFFEVGMARWKSNQSLKKIIEIKGIEHLIRAVKKNRGVILMSAHFTMLEISALIGRNEIVQEDLPPMVGMFRLGKNSIINQFFRNTRLRSTESLVTKFEVKDLIRALKDKKLVWYASDQSFTGKNAISVNFFKHPAMTNPGIIRIAKITGSPVLPYFPSRLANGKGYVLEVLPEIESFPSEDTNNDMKKIHALLEQHILQNPEQYYWIHRRFKTVADDKNPYQ
jgi:KDO2-lipid IV(A) lauroyltransferase